MAAIDGAKASIAKVSMMHIVQIIDTVRFGGAQKMQLTLAEAIQMHPVQLTVISLEENVQNSHFSTQLESLGVKIHYFPAQKLLDMGRIQRIGRFLRQGAFDCVHTHLTYANIVGTLAGRLAGVPVIASFRNSSIDSQPLRAFLETILMRYSAVQRMAVGHATANAHRQRMGGKSIVAIPNAVTLIPPLVKADKDALRRELVGDAKRPLIIAVGRLMAQKGYFDLIEAFDTVRQSFPNAALVIVGRGHLHDQMMADIQTRQLSDNIILLGARTDVPQLLAASDLYVSASHWEGLSNALLEAMAAGLPVVATSVNDTPNVVVTGTGQLVPSQTPAALAEAICHYLAHPEVRKQAGVAAREHIETQFNPAAWVQQMLTLYRSVLQEDGETAVQEKIA
ncbi:MAG: glycosyltransferase [Chloroflexi bacterium]|nr:glycosyltransferase [Chloroflexota bacterium]